MSESTVVDFSLVGKVALVTGAGRGIGQGIKAKAGADLVLPDYDLGIAEEAAAKVRAIGRRVVALVRDRGLPRDQVLVPGWNLTGSVVRSSSSDA